MRGRGAARLLVAALLGGVPAVGCDAGSPASARHTVPIDTVDGVVVVQNGAEGLWSDGDEWTVEEQFRIGGMNAPEEEAFELFLIGLSVGPQGSLYVLDNLRSQISVFSSDGEFRFRFAGQGGGPGEFDRAAAMGWDSEGRLWVSDALESRIAVFDSLGTVLRTALNPGRRPVNRILYSLHMEPGGTWIDQLSDSPLLYFVRRDTAATIIDTVAALRYPPRPEGGPLEGRLRSDEENRALARMLPRFLWTIGPDGTIWEGLTNQGSFAARGASGDTVRIIHTAHRSPTLSENDQQAADLIRDIVSEPILPQRYQALYATDDGHLLAQVPGEDQALGRTLDVFDPEGRFLGPVELPFAPHPRAEHAFRGDTIYAVTLDALDVPQIVKAVIQRRP